MTPEIVYQDAHLVIVDKPAGVVVHPGTGHQGQDLLTVLAEVFANRGEEVHLAPLHRLDRDTSGLVALGRSPECARNFARLLQEGQVAKEYLALVQGVSHRKGKVSVPLAHRDSFGPRQVMQEAETRYHRVLYTRAASLLRVNPVTGRPHQIRRHLRSIGHPVAGDDRWGEPGFNRWITHHYGLDRLFLHAYRLEFPHPMTGQLISLHQPMPEVLVQVLERMGFPPLRGPFGELEVEPDGPIVARRENP